MYLDSCFHGPGALESLHTVTQTRKTQGSREVSSHKCVTMEDGKVKNRKLLLVRNLFCRSLKEGTLKMCHARAYEWLKKKKVKGAKTHRR